MNLFCTLPCHPRPQIWNLGKEDTPPEMRGLIKQSKGGMGNQVIMRTQRLSIRSAVTWPAGTAVGSVGHILHLPRHLDVLAGGREEFRKWESSIIIQSENLDIDIKVDQHQPNTTQSQTRLRILLANCTSISTAFDIVLYTAGVTKMLLSKWTQV